MTQIIFTIKAGGGIASPVYSCDLEVTAKNASEGEIELAARLTDVLQKAHDILIDSSDGEDPKPPAPSENKIVRGC